MAGQRDPRPRTKWDEKAAASRGRLVEEGIGRILEDGVAGIAEIGRAHV